MKKRAKEFEDDMNKKENKTKSGSDNKGVYLNNGLMGLTGSYWCV